MIEIREVTTTGELKRFIRFKHDLYRGNPYWAPPLDRDELHTLSWDQNPAFVNCQARYWMAFRDGRAIGRIAAILNQPFVDRWEKRYLKFGWFDWIDDRQVAQALLEKAEGWARELGMTAVHGPLGFTDFDYEGMLIEGFTEPGTMATLYNHPYYPRHMEDCGYAKEIDWVEYEIMIPKELPERLRRVGELLAKRDSIRIFPARTAKDLLPYAHAVFELINVAYRNLYPFVELSKAQVDDLVRQYFPNVVPDFITLALDRNDKLAGFVIAMPSLSRALRKANGRLFPLGFLHLLHALKRPKYVDFYLNAVRPDLQNSGVEALMTIAMCQACIRRGIILTQSNIHLETNTKVQAAWKPFEHRLHKRRRCYIKHLTS